MLNKEYYKVLKYIAIIAIITYEIFSIIYLIKYYTFANNCEGSYLWEYIFISLMISLLAIAANYYKKHITQSVCTWCYISFISFFMSIWGCIELYNNSCKSLCNSNLWRFGLATFIIQILITIIYCSTSINTIIELTSNSETDDFSDDYSEDLV